MRMQIHACEAVACSLWALLRHKHHPKVLDSKSAQELPIEYAKLAGRI